MIHLFNHDVSLHAKWLYEKFFAMLISFSGQVSDSQFIVIRVKKKLMNAMRLLIEITKIAESAWIINNSSKDSTYK